MALQKAVAALDNLQPAKDCATIDEVRAAIDEIDQIIVTALGRRFEYVQSIVRFKKTAEDVHARERYNAVLAQRRVWALEHDLDPDVVEQLYRDLIAHNIAVELDHLNNERNQDHAA